ncbi:uncharacterized protein trim25l [Nematolebias whitei]|uniref:uncharacterized protein trim25l n=1 Tax=Nematolebias whitei TaxID=451745 RepID=UPI001897915D|nr:uncharacterized protein trim25l [Nematolebias whitei]
MSSVAFYAPHAPQVDIADQSLTNSADKVHNDVENVLSDLQHAVEKLQELLDEVMDQAYLEKMNQAQEVVDGLESEIKERKKRDTKMKDLANCEDNIYYLQTCESMSTPLECGDLPAVHVNPEASFEPVRDTIQALRERIEDLCNQELCKITKQANDATLFTLGNSKGIGQKGGLLKLFSGIGSRNANSRVAANNESSAIVCGVPFVKQRKHELAQTGEQAEKRREGEREGDKLPTQPDAQSNAQSQRESVPLEPVQSEAGCSCHSCSDSDSSPNRYSSSSYAGSSSRINRNRMASISSLFRSRRGTNQATSAAPANSATPVGENPFNPGLFLDTPTPDTAIQSPAFPALREINIDSIEAPEPRTREEFLQYSVSLTLDPNTAHKRLVLSEGDTKATLQAATQPYLDCPQRFDGWTQVMCQSPLYAQRSYWEVEWRGRGSSIGVAYAALSRKGSDARSGLGYNPQSWTLELSDTCCLAMHANQKRDIPVTYSPRLGIYLDLSTGMLAFYSVADNMTHLQSFRANFTQPLYAVFGVGSGVGVGLDFALGQFSSSSDSIKICPL